MHGGTFALVPIEVVSDRRLTLEQTRVLIALFSFRSKNTDTVWPSRSTIAERTGMHPSNISAATTALVSLGWLLKDGCGGRSRATRYTITVPEIEKVADQASDSNGETVAEKASEKASKTVARSATVADTATVAQSTTRPVACSATPPVADSARGIEHTSEQTNEQTSSAPSVPAVSTRAKKSVAQSEDETALQAACRETFKAYQIAYANQYGERHVDNAKVRTQIKQFVQRIGHAESPLVAAWFVGHPDSFYVKSMHGVGSLLKDAEKLRTEWATGRVMTAGKARQADRAGTTMAALAEVLAEQRGGM